MKHQNFTQERMQQGHDHRSSANRKPISSSSSPQLTSEFNYQKLLYWVPVIFGLILLFFAIIKGYLVEQERYYCFKTPFLQTKLNKQDKRQVLVNTRYDYKLYVDSLDDQISQKIAQTGSYQPKIINLIGHIAKIGDHSLFVGSHYGLQAISVAKITGQFSNTYVFQPTQFLSKVLNLNIGLNKLQSQIKVYKIAPSNVNSKGTIQVISTQKQENNTQSTSLEQIQYDRIDSILPSGSKLDMVYINTKNMAIKTLIGMKQTIKRSPKLVMIVKWDSRDKELINYNEYMSLINFLTNQGYKAYSYEGGQFRKSCSVGSFVWRGALQNLNAVKQQFVVFFPENYSLPR